ncbi:MAG: MFS transporter [Thermomicrobiales bacterium]
MTQLLSNRIFARFWLAGLFFVLATWSLHITMLVYVFELTGSPFATGLIPVFASVPGIVLGPIAGVLVDRWDRKRVMAGSAIALVGLLIMTIPFASQLGVEALYAIIFVQAMVMTFFVPAENALLPTLVQDDDLATANSLNALNDNLGRIIGPAVGAGIFVQFGFAATLVASALNYAAGWVCLVGVQSGTANPEAVTSDGEWSLREAGARMVSEFREGLGAVRTSRVLAVVVAVWALYMVADVPFSAVLPAFVGESLGMGPEGLGIMIPIRGLTGVIGGVLVVALSRRVPASTLLAGGLFGYGWSIAMLGVINDFGLGLWLTIVNGPSAAAVQTGLATTLQRATAPEMRGRVFSLVGIVNGVIVIVVSLAAGSLGGIAGTRAVVILSGALQVLPFLLVMTMLRRQIRPAR